MSWVHHMTGRPCPECDDAGELADCHNCGKPIWRLAADGVWVHTLTGRAACRPGNWGTGYAAKADA